MKLKFLIWAAIFWAAGTAWSAEPVAERQFRPAVIYQGSIENNSFNVTIHQGVARFESRTGLKVQEVVSGVEMSDYVHKVSQCTQNGYSPVFVLYGNHFPDLVSFVRQYPTTRFIVLDTVRDEPNVFSFVMAEHEGAFLAGALGAMASTTGVLGFVSVVDTPFMRRFLCGYTQGARYVRPETRVLEGFTGEYTGSWFDGPAAAAMADRLMDRNADVIFQAAGGAGPAVLKAVEERGRLGIGVDVNQNGLFPGSVLTSMVKRTDKAVFAALMLARLGVWRDNFKQLGLAQDAVDIVFDRHNQSLVTPMMRQRIEQIRKDIILGNIRVHNYTEDNTCP